jgi:hypothetical protein
MMQPVISKRLRQPCLRLGAVILAVGLAAGWLAGCHSLPGECHSTSETGLTGIGNSCPEDGVPIPRRFYVLARGPIGVVGPPQGFVMEVLAALNCRPGCNAILLPPDAPLDPLPGTAGPPMALLQLPERLESDPALEELVLIDVVEFQPFRPMRISAVIERRNISDGTTLSRDHRTWNAPQDLEPLSPSKFNRYILNHPQPLGTVEQQELSRLSPQAFYRNVAYRLAGDLVASPAAY